MSKYILFGLVVVILAFVGGSMLSNSHLQQTVGLQPTVTLQATIPPTLAKESGQYIEYSTAAFEEAKNKKRVIFFHATWCPTCKIAHYDFTSNKDYIPAGVVIFKTDYDTETKLQKQYVITYQHTFVQVDENGKEITRWIGGGVDELVSNLK
jgi:thioredoxin 1